MSLDPGKTALVVGGTSGIGLATARSLASAGVTVFVAGRDRGRADTAAVSLGNGAGGLALDLAAPASIAAALAGLPPVDYVVLCAMERDGNHVRTYDADRATRSVLVKLVGYVEVLHALGDRLTPAASVLIYGGAAYQRPTAGSVTTAALGAGVIGLARSLCVQLAPVRVNVIHPGVVDGTGLRSIWGQDKIDAVVERTPIGRLVTVAEVVEAGLALMSNPAVNGASLVVDGGWLSL